MGARVPRPPLIFRVNWFRTGPDGRYLWPGYAENFRVLRWIVDRCAGRGAARETPAGLIPGPGALALDGLDLPSGTIEGLLDVDRAGWRDEAGAIAKHFDRFGKGLPTELWQEHAALVGRLGGR